MASPYLTGLPARPVGQVEVDELDGVRRHRQVEGMGQVGHLHPLRDPADPADVYFRMLDELAVECRAGESQHARAHRPVDEKTDADAFIPDQNVTVNGIDYHLGWKD